MQYSVRMHALMQYSVKIHAVMQYRVRIQADATDIKVESIFWCGALNYIIL
jgi:hypothetical protein